jgi:hypothetical protein
VTQKTEIEKSSTYATMNLEELKIGEEEKEKLR